MFLGTCPSEFPFCTSDDMTQTFNGEVLEYDIFIDQQLLRDVSIKQKSSHNVYINTEQEYDISIKKQLKHDVYIEKQVNFDLEN